MKSYSSLESQVSKNIEELIIHLKEKRNIWILTGAGISAESGIQTFRDADGLWEGHDVMEVATPEGWHKNKELVLKFYNDRRRQLKDVQPNKAHLALSKLEEQYEVVIVTQNVDDLHERAGSKRILHLHGELLKGRSTVDPSLVQDWTGDITTKDKCPKGSQLRPHIVWFGEMVPMLEKATEVIEKTDVIIIVGTSMQVYPAASLTNFAPSGIPIYYVDPKPSINYELQSVSNLIIIQEPATTGVKKVVDELL